MNPAKSASIFSKTEIMHQTKSNKLFYKNLISVHAYYAR